MKRISGMKTTLPAPSIAALLLGGAMLAPIAYGQNNETIMQTVGNVPYVSGGIGIDSIDRLDTLSGQFNVKLVFALKSGEYLSEVKVTITDVRGKTMVDTMSDGPWFLTKLPPGKYQIVASFAGKAEKRAVAVGGARLSTVDFRWASE